MKTIRTKEQQSAFRKYILDCIDSEGYEVVCKNDRDKLEFLQRTFKNEYGWSIARHGEQSAFCEWLKGLPSSFGIEFTNYGIIEKAKEFGFIPKMPSEKQKDRALDLWWACLYMEFQRMLKKAQTLPILTIGEIKYRTRETSPHFFDRKTLKFFGQRMASFTIYRDNKEGKYFIQAPIFVDGRNAGNTQRWFNPVNNTLEIATEKKTATV